MLVLFRYAAARQPTPLPIGEPFGVFAGPGTQVRPAIAFDEGARRHLIVWADATAGDIYARVLNDQGIPVGLHFPVSLAPGAQISPTVAAGAPGQGFLVVWQDMRDGDWDVYGQRVSAAGRLLDAGGMPGADPTTNTALVEGPGDQHMPDVAYSPQSDLYLIAWVGTEPDAGLEIASRRVSSTGVPMDEPVTVVREPQAVSHPVAAYNSVAGEFLVVWQRQDVWIENRRVSASGELQGPMSRIWSSLLRPYPAPVPDVAYNPITGEYLVVWDDASDDNIYGFRVSADGRPAPGSDRIVISSATGLQRGAQVGVYSAGYLVVWEDGRDPESRNIFGQLLSAAGERVNSAGTPGAPADTNMALATAIPNQEAPALAFNPGGVEFLLAWAEDRLQGADILGQRLWFPAMGPRPTPTSTFTPTLSPTPTPTATPTITPTPTPAPPPRYLVLVVLDWSGE